MKHPVTRESRVCRLLSAACIEHSAGIARTRWALYEFLSDDARDFLDRMTRELQDRGIAAENEAVRIEYQATLPKDEDGGAGGKDGG